MDGVPQDTVPQDTVPFTPQDAAALVAAAGAAPSIHNSQPWRFEVRADRVEVRVDRLRALPAVDPDGRQLLISCGAAVLNLRLAIAHLGSAPITLLVPAGDTDHVATVARGGPAEPSRDERALYDMVRWRRTNRGRYRPQPVPAPVLRRLHAAVAHEAATLRVIDGPRERDLLAELIRRGIEAEAAMPDVRAEFLGSLRDAAAPSSGMPSQSWREAPYPLPALHGHDRLAPDERDRVEELARRSTLAVLCTAGDGTEDRLRAGQALQRMLLTATGAGVAVSFLNQPVEVPELRRELAAIAGAGEVPQLVLRAGYAGRATIPTGRRSG